MSFDLMVVGRLWRRLFGAGEFAWLWGGGEECEGCEGCELWRRRRRAFGGRGSLPSVPTLAVPRRYEVRRPRWGRGVRLVRGRGPWRFGGVAVAAEDAADEAAEVGAGGFAEDAARLEGLRGPIDGPERSMAAVIRQEAKPLAPRRFPEGFDAAPPFRRSLHVRLAVRDHTQGKYQYRSAIDSCHGRELP
jgi:hypothetical protein